jgi:DnaK suppressor protein
MTQAELSRFKTVLAGRQAELSPLLWKRDGIAIEKTPDALDEVQLATERELATRNLERESKLLRNVRAALDRIDEGAYGICLHCEEEIGAKRLNALPWTPLCIECQKQLDRSRESGIESQAAHEWLGANAA